jgi:hypothetical protein
MWQSRALAMHSFLGQFITLEQIKKGIELLCGFSAREAKVVS